MIFVTVGMHYQGFDRLIKKMDEIAGKINEEIIIQIGCTKYTPKNTKYFDFVENEEEIAKYFRDARVVISHAGAGNILMALRYSKPLIVVPRLKRFGEHVNDQQLELAEFLSSTRRVIAVYNIEEIEDALSRVDKLSLSPFNSEKKMIRFLKDYLRSLEDG